jgi:hypothetical protein
MTSCKVDLGLLTVSRVIESHWGLTWLLDGHLEAVACPNMPTAPSCRVWKPKSRKKRVAAIARWIMAPVRLSCLMGDIWISFGGGVTKGGQEKITAMKVNASGFREGFRTSRGYHSNHERHRQTVISSPSAWRKTANESAMMANISGQRCISFAGLGTPSFSLRRKGRYLVQQHRLYLCCAYLSLCQHSYCFHDRSNQHAEGHPINQVALV